MELDLFEDQEPQDANPAMSGDTVPLAERMRPVSLEDYVGQSHILGEGRALRRAIEADRIQSLILYGPPGIGKTSLAQVIAKSTKNRFERLSGVESNVGDMRRVLTAAANRLANQGVSTILFIDEIHRFNKAQQDVLLPDVERGVARLIGATTHNPFFFINSPLVSRSQIYELKPLTADDISERLEVALRDKERGLGEKRIEAESEALEILAWTADGDLRKALNGLEIAALTTEPSSDGVIRVTPDVVRECIQKAAVVYDADGDAHYDTISAFIKSMRGSDVDATLHWLAKMIHSGEDPRFIARRIVICAAEDVGLADPTALILANAAAEAAQWIGWPEARIPIAQAAMYLATAPKSGSVVAAIDAAMADVEAGHVSPTPNHLRDGHFSGAKRLGRGQGYQYPHAFPGNFIPQVYFELNRRYYEPSDQGREARIAERIAPWREALEAFKRETGGAKNSRE